MSAEIAAHAPAPAKPAIGFFERWLSLWVFSCIVAGIVLGQWLPALFQALGRLAAAPIVGLLLGLSAITVPWDSLFVSVGLYIEVPVMLSVVKIVNVTQAWYERSLPATAIS